MQEIEIRGPLNKNQIAQLASHFSNQALAISSYNEDVLFFETASFPEIGSFETGQARLSLKLKGDKAYFRAKYGNAVNLEREEHEFCIDRKEAPSLLTILGSLGIKKAFFRPCLRTDYKLDKLLVTVKQKTVIGDHFEIETTIQPGETLDIAISRLSNFASLYDLQVWSKDEYKYYVQQSMQIHPAIDTKSLNLF